MFKIGRVAHTLPHLLADTVEIALAFGEYDQISTTDLLGIIRQSPKPAQELLNLVDEDIDDDDAPDDLDGAQQTEREQGYIEECWRQLAFRAGAFANSYPYVLDGEILRIREDLDYDKQLYILLLACSRTRSFMGKGVTQRLADIFELISAECMRQMMSPSGKVFMFGPNSDDRAKLFGKNLTDALPKLVGEMGMRLKAGWQKNYGTSGDGKIDIVGVYPFDRFAAGIQVVIGQCASMEEEGNWERKRKEAMLQFQAAAFDYLVEPQGVLFIPVCFRQPDGDWVRPNSVAAVITMDRLRIMTVLADKGGEVFDVTKLLESAGIAIAA
ncbi:hypothetical protein VW23_017935 [Devosia insulae DS-56]|uniref:Restriction endonuclease n=1 Tax=Devosia insulae DS-56 TaxID=1116389 RepID=A0A1E5XR71_9HYPH|nr:hypothetical protein [Devosia insulae]OEO31090.1 hypothetical protein VW23_017935 [Devosia insulae DS-56]